MLTKKEHNERILRALVHIQENLDGELSLEVLAGVAGYSPYHFHRVFRGMVGESLSEHVRRLRLERAALRLRRGEQPVTEVALDAGYETHESFTRAFRARFGRAPSDWRKERPEAPPPEAPSGVHWREDGAPSSLQDQPPADPPGAVRIEARDPIHVAFLRHTGPYDQVGRTWSRLFQWAAIKGLLMRKTEVIGVAHDDPDVTPPDKVRYDACLRVGRPLEPEGHVGFQTIPAAEYAILSHRGPYDTLGEAYVWFCGRWIPESGREMADRPCLEFYLNSPLDTAPESLRTDIYLPLR